MQRYTANLEIAQAGAPISGDAEALSEADILPKSFHQLAPDDKTVALACLYARDNPLSRTETKVLTAALLAWERGDISSVEAFGAMWANECLPADEMLGVYLTFMRARAAADIGRAA